MKRGRIALTYAAVVTCLLLAAGCQEGQYEYRYSGVVLQSDGVTPAEGVRLIPKPGRRGPLFGGPARFNADDPVAAVSGPDGWFNGTMKGWFATPVLWPFPPQECRPDKVWVYLPEDPAATRWKAVVVPARVEKGDRPCTGVISDLHVVLPD